MSLLQLFEYVVMINIILIQKKKKPDELLYNLQFNASRSIDSNQLPQQVKMKIKGDWESCLKIIFIIIFVIDIGALLFENVHLALEKGMNLPIDMYIVEYQFASLMVKMIVFTLTFLVLLFLMKKQHHYEFKLRRLSMIFHFLVIVLFFVAHNCLAIRYNFCVTKNATVVDGKGLINEAVVECLNETPYATINEIMTPI